MKTQRLLSIARTTVTTHRLFLMYLLFSVAIRVVNAKQFLYFIYDQGVDMWNIQHVVQGNITLLGPSTGLQGFYLGPLWTYVGVPGFILGGGNPYVVAVWYIIVACLAVPGFWILSRFLFPHSPPLRFTTALLLSISAGSIAGSTFVWNPLLSIPLLSLGLVALFLAYRSQTWLFIGSLLLAFILHAEFAYGIFILPVLAVVPLLTHSKRKIHDYAIIASAVLITLIPQFIFEWRHQFVMTQALIHSITSSAGTVSWGEHLMNRSRDLLDTTGQLFVGNARIQTVAGCIVLAIILIGIVGQVKKGTQQLAYFKKLLLLLAIAPYIGFLVWRGNDDKFFDYYLTPHFIILVSLFMMGLAVFLEKKKQILFYSIVGILIGFSFLEWHNRLIAPRNRAGMTIMLSAIQRIYEWEAEDNTHGPVRIYTPNRFTDHYDYLFTWYAKQHQLFLPRTIRTTDDTVWYTIMERDDDPELAYYRFQPWYQEIRQNGVLVRRERVGALTIETWMTSGAMANKGKAPYTELPLFDTIINQAVSSPGP